MILTKNTIVMLPLYHCVRLATYTGARIESITAEICLQMLRDDIKQYEEYIENRDTQSFTILKIAGNELGFEKLCKIYDSLHNEDNSDEMLSVITVKSIKDSKSYNPEEYMQNFIKAMQEYINQNENSNLQVSLGLTIDYVKRAHIRELEDIYITRAHKNYCYKKLEGLVFDHFCTICMDGLKDIFVGQSISTLKQQSSFYTSQAQTTDSEMFQYCAAQYLGMVANIEKLLKKDKLFDSIRWDFSAKRSTFSILYAKICQYENEVGIEYYTNNQLELNDLYKYLIRVRYQTMFKEGFNDLVKRCLGVLYTGRSENSFATHFKPICYGLIKYFTVNRVSCGCKYNEGVDWFCSTKEFASSIQRFFAGIKSEKIINEFNSYYTNKVDFFRQKLGQETITKIVYNREINNNTLHLLCGAIKQHKIFEDSYNFKTIYMDCGRRISDSAVKRCSKICSKLAFEFDSACKMVEFFTAIEQANDESIQRKPSKNFTYKRVISDDSDETTKLYSNDYKTTNETKITLVECDDIVYGSNGRFFDTLKRVCIVNNNSMLVRIDIVSIQNGFNTSHICILQHTSNETRRDIVSFIYDIPYQNRKNSGLSTKMQDRSILCMDDVPMSFFINLVASLKLLQLSRRPLLEISNLSSLSTFDLIHTEKIISSDKSLDLFSHLASFRYDFYHLRFLTGRTIRVFIGHIIEFEKNKRYGDTELNLFVSYFGLSLNESEFYEIMRELVLNKRVYDVKNLEISAWDINNPNNFVNLSFVEYEKGHKSLHISDPEDSNHGHNIAVNPIKNLTGLIEFSESLSTMKIIESAIKKTNSEVSFLMLVIRELCNNSRISIQPDEEVDNNIVAKECIKIIYNLIERLFVRILDNSKCTDASSNVSSVANTQYLVDIQKAINPEQLNHLAQAIAQGSSFKDKRRYRHISMEISKQDDRSNLSNGVVESNIRHKRYLNLTYWNSERNFE